MTERRSVTTLVQGRDPPRLLNALGNHVDAQAGKKVTADGARVIQGVIAEIQQVALPPGPCIGRWLRGAPSAARPDCAQATGRSNAAGAA
jgi:hypothetical protein